MRVKTDQRRSAIVTAAWKVFKENGFERASMNEISTRARLSKTTIYGYFASKEDLLLTALKDVLEHRASEVFLPLDGTLAMQGGLTKFAHEYLLLRFSPDIIAIERILIAEAGRTSIGDTLRKRLITIHFSRLASALRSAMERGDLLRSDPFRAAMELKALIESDLFERCLHDPATRVGARELEQAEQAVETFLRAYTPGKAAPSAPTLEMPISATS